MCFHFSQSVQGIAWWEESATAALNLCVGPMKMSWIASQEVVAIGWSLEMRMLSYSAVQPAAWSLYNYHSVCQLFNLRYGGYFIEKNFSRHHLVGPGNMVPYYGNMRKCRYWVIPLPNITFKALSGSSISSKTSCKIFNADFSSCTKIVYY